MKRISPERLRINRIACPILLLFIFLSIQCSSGLANENNANAALVLTSSIPMAGVIGRIDHMAYNSKRQVVYIAALGNNSVEVVDLKSKKVIHTIKALSEPQGIRYIPESNVIFVANGASGECDVFNAETYHRISAIQLEGDADNVRYDPVAAKIFVGYGDGMAIIDAKTFKLLADIKLPGHPESFQLDNDAKELFVNVPDIQLLMVLDLVKNTIKEKWKTVVAAENFPMALDAVNHRLFIGCRKPAKLVVINSETGNTISSVHIDSDTDDIFYDGTSKQIYVSCGGGYIDVIKQTGPDQYEVRSKTESRSGARTSLFLPELNQLIVAAPSHLGKAAQLMIYRVK
jgi:YVTN family beta-propeller protein